MNPDKNEFSTVVYDTNGEILRAFLNKNEQWCFPPDKNLKIPKKLKYAVLTFEDKRFYKHIGIDFRALSRSIYLNLKHKKILTGASTITMQLTRLLDPKSRIYSHKFLEFFQAIKLEIFLSKDKILQRYFQLSPYGKNIIGYHAASLKYFGKSPAQLSWSEAAVLAVLPNSPALITPGKNHHKLIRKRNFLLKKMYERKLLTQEMYLLSIKEKIKTKIHNFPQFAPHITRKLKQNSADKIIKTTIDKELQAKISSIAKSHSKYLQNYGIDNLSILLTETKSGKVRAYLGSQNYWDNTHSGKVDGINAPRSSGSILKPFLYALSIDEGTLIPESQLEDIPIYFSSFTPLNANNKFSGLVSAKKALVSSLNVPAVNLLREFGTQNFSQFLKEAGITTLFRSSNDYGLTLIIGGAEVTLWDLSVLFRGLANYGEFSSLQIIEGTNQSNKSKKLLSKGACYLTLEMLKDLNRPDTEHYWQLFENSRPLAWKTGTSFGQRDAWAIGTNPEWTIAVWVGNFSGEGNSALGGAKSAAPILFDIFNSLTTSNDSWFKTPLNDMKLISICSETGYAATEYCLNKKEIFVPSEMKKLKRCPYHKQIHITKNEEFQTCSLCWEENDHKPKIVLQYPPEIVQTLRKNGRFIDKIPSHNPKCVSVQTENSLKIIYPTQNAKLFLPREIGGSMQKISFKIAHQFPETSIYWYLDEVYLGTTQNQTSMSLELGKGKHILTVIDENGKMDKAAFSVITKED